jgi:hypothetical protein
MNFLFQEWNKHWFVLRGAALMYYRDPAAEDKGILDGVIDLNGVNSISEVQVARNYGFQTLVSCLFLIFVSVLQTNVQGFS